MSHGVTHSVNDYETRERLISSVRVSLFCALLWTIFFKSITLELSPPLSPLALSLCSYFMVTLNTYEIVMHILVFLKFLGFRNVAYGAQEDQTALGFTGHNLLDALGFFSYMAVTGNNSWIYCLLLGVHLGANVIAFTDPFTFQEFYIRNNPTSKTFRSAKTVFVMSDAIFRVLGLYHYLFV